MLAAQLQLVNVQVLENDRQIRVSARSTEIGRRLMEIPGIGPVIASALVATVPDPHAFRCGRNLSAWIGLVPKQNSTGGKERLGSITKQGNRYLRKMLVVGALAVIRYAQRNGTRRPWLVQLMERRTTKVAAVALANKTARIIWKLMVSGERYRPQPTRQRFVPSTDSLAPGRRRQGHAACGGDLRSALTAPALGAPGAPPST